MEGDGQVIRDAGTKIGAGYITDVVGGGAD